MVKNLVPLLVVLLTWATTALATPASKGACLVCHQLRTPDLYAAWLGSAHARHNVTCLDCHEAAADEPDAYRHGGALVSLLVTPRDCAGCHQPESSQYQASGHAFAAVDPQRAGDWGDPATCKDCHGSPHLADPEAPNRLVTGAWPDRGAGRINPDGSRGSCSACHTDHAFDTRRARGVKTCIDCHSRGHLPHHPATGRGGGPELPASEQRTCIQCHERFGHGGAPKVGR
jgi:hydroxylamine dehydrogenase